MQEQVDRVNDLDEVVGVAMRSECHKNGWWHRWAAVILFRNEKREEILIQTRSLQKEASPGKECLVGGHLSAGDTYIEWARRECAEEILGDDISLVPELTELFKIQKTSEADNEFITVFSGYYDGPIILQKTEVEHARFVDVSILRENIMSGKHNLTDTTVVMLQRFFDV